LLIASAVDLAHSLFFHLGVEEFFCSHEAWLLYRDVSEFGSLGRGFRGRQMRVWKFSHGDRSGRKGGGWSWIVGRTLIPLAGMVWRRSGLAGSGAGRSSQEMGECQLEAGRAKSLDDNRTASVRTRG